MKKILWGASALVATLVLTGCSGGGESGGGGAVAAADVVATTTPSTTVETRAKAPKPKPTTSKPKSAPKTTTSKPRFTSAATTMEHKAKPRHIAGMPCAATVSACVDLSAHKAWLIDDGEVRYGPVPMLPGRTGNATPTGTFHVYSKEKMHLSKEFDNAKMPNSVFFYPGDAFHTGSLTTYSHGCIHLSSTASLKFFNSLSVGDVVQVVS